MGEKQKTYVCQCRNRILRVCSGSSRIYGRGIVLSAWDSSSKTIISSE